MVMDVKAKVKFLLHNEQFQLDHVLHFNPTRITLIFFDIKIWIFQIFITKRCWQSLLFSTTECSFRRVLIWCKIHYLFTLKSLLYPRKSLYMRICHQNMSWNDRIHRRWSDDVSSNRQFFACRKIFCWITVRRRSFEEQSSANSHLANNHSTYDEQSIWLLQSY